MAIEIVDFPIKNGGSFHSYVKLPEGTYIINIQRSTSMERFHSRFHEGDGLPLELSSAQLQNRPGACKTTLIWR
jgi:hypothetical protein